ncbi:MAG: DUF499 domain-containing protein, partial [Thermoproteota archaeon]
LGVLTRVAYPRRDATGDEVKIIDTTPSSSIIAQVEAALKDPHTGPKLRTDFTFNDLVDFLKSNLGWNLVEGNKRFEFREILQVFYTNTAAPFTIRKAVEQAIFSGVESLEIGVKVGEKSYWKRVGPENGAEKPERIEDTSEILPYKIAAKLLSDKLLSESGVQRTPERVRRVWYEVEIAGRSITLEDLIRREGWERTVKEGVIVEREEIFKRGFILDVKPSVLEVKPKEEAKVTVLIEPVGEYSEEVKLEVSGGSLSTSKDKPPFKADWKLTLPEGPGNYNFTVKAVGPDGTVKEVSLSVTVLSPEVDIEINKIDSTRIGAKLLSISQTDLLPLRIVIDIVSKLNIRAKASMTINFGEEASFSADSIDTGIARLFVQKFDDILRSLTLLGVKTTVMGIVTFEEPMILDSSKIAAMSPLNEKAKFKLRVKRE